LLQERTAGYSILDWPCEQVWCDHRAPALKAPLVVGRDAELRALVSGSSFAGCRHLAGMRGARQLIGGLDTAKDSELARHFSTLTEEVTDVRVPQ
jgi:hypothetical protein